MPSGEHGSSVSSHRRATQKANEPQARGPRRRIPARYHEQAKKEKGKEKSFDHPQKPEFCFCSAESVAAQREFKGKEAKSKAKHSEEIHRECDQRACWCRERLQAQRRVVI
jgi:hypothetical protein